MMQDFTHKANVHTLEWKRNMKKKYFICVLFTFIFKTTKWKTTYYSLELLV